MFILIYSGTSVWHADYLNLIAGAEIPTWLSGAVAGLDHYFVDFSLAMPMTLNLYNYYSKDKIDTVFNWAPDNEQWWITGFNPECVGNVDVTKQVMIGTVDFSGNEEMYEEFKKNTENEDVKKEFIIFDDDNLTAWVCWCEEALM